MSLAGSSSSNSGNNNRANCSMIIIPTNYTEIRPHHLLLLYSTFYLIGSSSSTSTSSSARVTKVLKKVSEQILQSISSYTDSLLPLIYSGYIPDILIRYGIRLRLRDQLYTLASSKNNNDDSTITTAATAIEDQMERKMSIVQYLSTMPIAINTKDANEQHYEVPTKFYDLCLGPYKKYSCGYWSTNSITTTTTFAESEIQMLQLYCQRANVQDGMSIVDLGCGWGSLTLYLAKHYPNCRITSISNSASQREYIYKTAAAWGLNVQNITVITCNVADDKGALELVTNNDLVMTVEMLEHMKNYDLVFKIISGFLKPGGQLFVHIFTHREYCYHFDKGWMSDNFFTGGTMPSDDLLLYFCCKQSFTITNHWCVNGTHYEKTSNAWLRQLDDNWKNGTLQPVLADAYGIGKEREWYINWRLFFLACAELWGLDNGQEYIVSHYLFTKQL